MKPSAQQQLWMYETMCLIRHYEDTLAIAYFEGKLPPKIQKGLAFDLGAGPIPGEMHLAAGQESAAVGTCIHLAAKDSVWGTHRAHHFAIAKGVDLERMTAEIFGKVTGLGRGKGGHMHLFDTSVNFACTGIVGGGIPHAVGAALAYKKLGSGCGGSRRIRRGRVQPGLVPRGTEHGRALEAAVRVRLPGQQLRHFRQQGEFDRGCVDRRARVRLRHARRARHRERPRPDLSRQSARRSHARALAKDLRCSRSRSIACTATSRATRRPTGRRARWSPCARGIRSRPTSCA